ncbi:hypothetical protein [Nesterenkonia muleiensis]|uniref:hypothetical protein n=1 Tax=Nesterenkonia muleiensis TaxID=2282648 RepID=UPI000E72E7A8|nr:hypothetical protein [Nesterenkonia muleiensis]
MHNTTWTPGLSILGAALLVSSCAADTAATDDVTATPEQDEEIVTSGEVDGTLEDDVHSDDIYAPPLPPGSEAPPIYDYEDVPVPDTPFEHAPIEQAFADALDDGAEPDDAGLIEFDEPIRELTVKGQTFTVDGVIDPSSATPLYEDQLTQDGAGPITEELTGIPWPDRRSDILDANASATSCEGNEQYIWLSYDTAETPTCFEESGGVTDPYFRTISAVCHSSESQRASTLYMGLGGEYSFNTPWGHGTGWDMTYQGPQTSGANSCYAFTVPVRGADTTLSNVSG